MHLLTIGGDHTIALPPLRAAARRHGPVAVLHLDPHLDTWDTYFGAAYTHGTPFRRAGEEGLLDPQRCLHMGIRRPLYAPSDLRDDQAVGFQVVTADYYQDTTMAAIVEQAPAYDHAEITDIAAAHVGYELLAVLARNRMAAVEG